MEHIEDLVFNEGVDGTRKAIKFLIELRNMLAGHTSTAVKTTVKWDGAPAVFCGIDPSDGKFFVAKKGIFNKEAKVYKTPDDVKADTGGDLQAKLLIALSEFSKLGIKSGVYQGDLMFTSGDISTETYDGEKYYTFQPNTIVYAVPVNSALGKQINKAKIGVVILPIQAIRLNQCAPHSVRRSQVVLNQCRQFGKTMQPILMYLVTRRSQKPKRMKSLDIYQMQVDYFNEHL